MNTMDKQSWHLSKTITIGLMVTVLTATTSGAIVWANLKRDVEDCAIITQRLEPKVTAIYEGLLSQGIIQPIKY